MIELEHVFLFSGAAVASMPSREELIAQIVSQIGAPASNIAGAIGAPASNIASILSTIEERAEAA